MLKLNKKVTFRFYEELNDFLPKEKKKRRFIHNYIDRVSVKDVIESLGVPHTEVDLILLNGNSVGFDYLINNDDDLSVYPVFESLDISDVQHLRATPLRKPKFVADVHLGRLTKYLRMMGFNVSYKNNFNDDEIVGISLDEKRAILTKDRGILKRNEVTHGYWVRSTKVKEQTVEILKRFDLKKQIKEFSRCIECNQLLILVQKEKIADELPTKVAQSQNKFYRCPSCKKLFWKGTHYHKMLSFIQSVKNFEF
ncbi:MAG: Mut7-C ubiquitin/RNAse domain-containing protein [Ignavibacteria bacterium]|nr:Mut7-C ubiquitin/RNAse domain-containing protein [Ignavibacteria bacterium]MBT8391412.1 Mut7-C ubiquitin/RNAse domain-containing protein [Ignavibacteria bacterium]NNL19850.1 Mut7-C ubiquitin/RNAse domain-containing protein [Ignavibacteriaceae bacterium]